MLRFIALLCLYKAVIVLISIHLMLRFIDVWCSACLRKILISIHLMLRFIKLADLLTPPVNHFNTSHVTVYHNYESAPHIHRLHFNTSHVTVYPREIISHSIRSDAFQYISCYGLSCFIPLKKVVKIYFNTSHVTVYLMFVELIMLIL